ncbi:MAG: ABC transporter substrate-binding protein [Planctomycetaceae bacterium]|nr:ABC transporter substrate-binding protein [Planctomycetaceae bacterium]
MRKLLLAVLLCLCTATVGAEESVLRFSWWGGAERHEATLAAIRAFEAATPGVTVKAEYMGWDGYLERLTTQIGAQSEADVMQVDWAWLAMFSKDGNGFYDAYDLKDSMNLDEYEQQWLDSGTVKGKLNAFPVSFSALVVVYNKDTWQKAGLPFPKTWDDLVAAGKVFKEKLGPEYYPLDLNRDERVYLTHAYIFQKTGKQFLDPEKAEVALSREELIDWLGYYKRLLDSGTLMTPQDRASIGGDNERQSQEFKEFMDGVWAGSCTFDAALANRLGTVDSDTFAVGPFPTMDGAKSSGRVGRPAMMFAISKNTKNPIAAGKMIDFLLASEEGAKILKSTRGAFLTKTGYATLLKEGLIKPINQEAMDQVRATQCHTPNPYFEHARTKNLMHEVFEEVGYGVTSLEDGADTLLREGNRIAKRLGR